jgi:hypothetical protein
MSHVACTQGNRVDSWLLMIKSQTVNLIPNLSFGHNFCFRCPNEWCEPTHDIYTSIGFRWYKGLFKAMGFEPCNRVLKKLKILLGLQLPTWEFLWECEGSCPHTFCTPRSVWNDSQVSLLAHNLATPLPCPCLGCEPKVRVATLRDQTFADETVLLAQRASKQATWTKWRRHWIFLLRSRCQN